MGMIMAVSFERYGRLYYLDPGGHQPKIGDKVLVPTDGGPEVAECVWAPQWMSEDVDGLPVCAGPARQEDQFLQFVEVVGKNRFGRAIVFRAD